MGHFEIQKVGLGGHLARSGRGLHVLKKQSRSKPRLFKPWPRLPDAACSKLQCGHSKTPPSTPRASTIILQICP